MANGELQSLFGAQYFKDESPCIFFGHPILRTGDALSVFEKQGFVPVWDLSLSFLDSTDNLTLHVRIVTGIAFFLK